MSTNNNDNTHYPYKNFITCLDNKEKVVRLQQKNNKIPSIKDIKDPNLYYRKEYLIEENENEDENEDKKVIQNHPQKIKMVIDKEINSITDLIYLINTYPILPTVEYNINMEILHKIKIPLEKLNNMIGIHKIKENIIDQILFYMQNLHNFNNNDFMHTAITGPPGTGKTEIAMCIGSIFAKLGVLTKGTFTKVTRSDLIAGFLGQTAIKTKEVIKNSIGGVLFIDEAYALGSSEKRDSFSKECIDTLCEAASDYKNNLMIIIAGYDDELNECFFSQNPGLTSRFIWRFNIEKYTSADLYNIFLKKIKEDDWYTDNYLDKEWFENKKEYFKYYGRDIEVLFTKTKIAHSRRIFGKSPSDRKILTKEDIEKGFTIFLNNTEIAKRKEKTNFKNMMSSMYV